ncbi:MAG: DinB family protein [Acidobacteriota bacterium]|nr:DinB family protein [Acidobacteriota bacterium]
MVGKTIETDRFLRNSLFVLCETFEGSSEGEGSAYLDRGVGVFSTLQDINHNLASTAVAGSTVAAHTEHLKFYIDRLVEFMNGRKEKVNWEQSWLIETVDEDEWQILREGVRKTYEKLLQSIAETKEWNDEAIGGMIAIIAHCAYHLGAIRQISKAAKAGNKTAAN